MRSGAMNIRYAAVDAIAGHLAFYPDKVTFQPVDVDKLSLNASY